MKYKLAYDFLLEAEVIFDEQDLIYYCKKHNNFIPKEEATYILNYLHIKTFINKKDNYYTKAIKLLKDPHNKQTILFASLLNNPHYNQKTDLKNAFKMLCLDNNNLLKKYKCANKETEVMFQNLYSISNNTHRFEYFNY